MKIFYVMGMEDIAIVCLCAFVIFVGVAITRVGIYGEHLGRFKCVSYVQKHAERPRRHHRWLTAGMGIVLVLLGLAFLIFEWVLLHMKVWAKFNVATRWEVSTRCDWLTDFSGWRGRG
jgi:uncharacterized membrane protein HdeD (DUF308 family)